jgi:hypothetical protein
MNDSSDFDEFWQVNDYDIDDLFLGYTSQLSARTRRPYRTGVDARRTEPWRSYHDHSTFFRYLTENYGKMTMKMLRNIVEEICSQHQDVVFRPSRNQLRVKNGLYHWMDMYSQFVFAYLDSKRPHHK